ncbi:hypothetical protein GGP41_007024 [Bipolaris sorokiniana]|uniref:Uncharacterized protein n=1 Tax=Cochliobolus sativus TaxID=45130 RepID=A0A8H5ZRW4_COCSA|nr:hypothetical protein GGP41_007024 [Bipolaris sorokiniana]
MTAASLLDIVPDVYNPFVLHTSPPTPHPSLPPNLHPVREQILIPHHPALDALLWPSSTSPPTSAPQSRTAPAANPFSASYTTFMTIPPGIASTATPLVGPRTTRWPRRAVR